MNYMHLTIAYKSLEMNDNKHKVEKRRSKMQHKRLKLSTIFLLGLGLTALQAQESINTTGGNASGSSGSSSYSVGQIVYTTNTGTNGSVAEGVQQPYEISVVTAIEDSKGINLSILAYPNPANDYLMLMIHEFDISGLTYQLYDIHGKLLQSENILKDQTRIDIAQFISSTYFVKVIQNNKEVKTFKIIKN